MRTMGRGLGGGGRGVRNGRCGAIWGGMVTSMRFPTSTRLQGAAGPFRGSWCVGGKDYTLQNGVGQLNTRKTRKFKAVK
jgi:hypothetical protein